MIRYFYAEQYSNSQLLTNRVNSIMALPEGTTTNDARLEDICNGYDNTVYDSPGNAVREQIKNLKNNIKNNINYLKYNTKINNILLVSQFSNGTWSWEDHNIINTSKRMIASIPIKNSTKYNVKFYNDYFQISLLEMDNDNNCIANHEYTNTDYTFISKESSIYILVILKWSLNNNQNISVEDILSKFDIDVFIDTDTIFSEIEDLYTIQNELEQTLSNIINQQNIFKKNQSYLQSMYNTLSNILKLEYIKPVNKFDPDAIEHFTRIENDGRITTHISNSLTGFIKCKLNDTIFFARTYNNSSTLSPITPIYISEYDEDKNFICRNDQYKTNGTTGYFDITNSNTTFIRAEVPDTIFTDFKYSVIINYLNQNIYTEYFDPYYKINPQNIFENSNIITKLRIMSYNIGGFNYGSGSESGIENDNLDASLKNWKQFFGIYHPDIIGVQEFKGYIDRSQSLSSIENLFGKFYPYINDCYNMEHPGWASIAVMSKWNCIDTENLKLTETTGQIDRWAVIQHIIINGKIITFVSTHLCPNATAQKYNLSESDVRNQEINQLIERLATEQNVIITGDFNVTNTNEYIPFINAGYLLCNGGTFDYKRTFNYAQNYTNTANPDADLFIDNIIISSNIIINSVNIPEEAYNLCTSDHLPIYADIMIL